MPTVGQLCKTPPTSPDGRCHQGRKQFWRWRGKLQKAGRPPEAVFLLWEERWVGTGSVGRIHCRRMIRKQQSHSMAFLYRKIPRSFTAAIDFFALLTSLCCLPLWWRRRGSDRARLSHLQVLGEEFKALCSGMMPEVIIDQEVTLGLENQKPRARKH